MRSKLALSVLILSLTALLIAGTMGAWFTAEDDLPEAKFLAGTLKISADDGPSYEPIVGETFENVNPGDCGRVSWDIVNTGSKALELRVRLSELWEGNLSTDNFYYAPAPESDWVMYDEDGEIWLYYTGGSVLGTHGGASLEERTVPLTLIVAFDGELTDNDYQGQKFELSGKVEAVQASNAAPADLWDPAWSVVTGEGYKPGGLAAEYLEYIMETACWRGGNGGDEPGEDEPGQHSFLVVLEEVEYVEPDSHFEYFENVVGKVYYEGTYAIGNTVILVAIDNEDYEFIGWSKTPDRYGELKRGNWMGNGTYHLDYQINDSTEILYAIFANRNKG